MLKRFFRLLASVYLCVAISVFSLHLYFLVAASEAIRGPAYASTFLMTGAFGWAAGLLFFFLGRTAGKKKPGVMPYLFAVFGVYAALLIILSIGYEVLRFGAAPDNGSLTLFAGLPVVMLTSPLGFGLIASAPFFLWVELAVFSPLVLFLGVLSKRHH